MLNIFRKRKESQPEAPPLPACMHTWKDFPWFMTEKWEENDEKGPRNHFDYNYPRGKLTLILYEPYVCAHCHERKDVRLSNSVQYNIPFNKKDEAIKQFTEKYKDYIQPVAIVEDMINDFIYVDREKLDILDKLRQKKDGPKI